MKVGKPGLGSPVAYWGVFFSLTGVWLAAELQVARLGLSTPKLAIFGSTLFLLSVAFSPFAWPWAIKPDAPMPAAGLVLPVAIAMLQPLLGLLIGQYSLLLIVGTAALSLYRAWPHIRAISARDWLALSVFPLCVAYYVFAQMHRAPLWFVHAWLPEHALLGIQVIDSYYHAALVNMIGEFGVASTGLDGLVRHYYHLGSHYWFAGFGRILGIQALTTYMTVHTIVVLPALMMAFYYSALFAAQRVGVRTTHLGVAAAALLIFIDRFNVKTYLFSSESFALSLIFLSLFLMILIQFFDASLHHRGGRVGKFIVATLLIPLVVSTKGPTGLVMIATLSYVWFRHYGFVARTIVEVLVFAVVWSLPTSYFLISEFQGLGTAESLFKSRAEWDEAFGALGVSSAALSLSGIFVSMHLLHASSRYTVSLERISWFRNTLLLEVLILGVVISLSLSVMTFAGIYFVWALFWIAAPLLIVSVSDLVLVALTEPPFKRLRQIIQRSTPATAWLVMSLGICVLAFLSFAPAPGDGPLRFEVPGQRVAAYMVEELNKRQRDGFLGQRSSEEYLRNTFVREGVFFSREFARALSRTTGAAAAIELRREARYEGPNTAVYVDPGNSEFWKLTAGQCRAVSFFVPAVVGLPMVLGLPPVEFHCPLEWYGFRNYRGNAHSRTIDRPTLCSYAAKLGFANVIALKSKNGAQHAESQKCRPAS